MANIVSHDSSEVVVQERKLYTGLSNIKVKLINPTKVELEAIGIKLNKEPEYLGIAKETGNKTVRIDIYVEKPISEKDTIKSKVTFFLENRERENNEKTKYEWINLAGVTAWGKEVPEYDWFKKEGARKIIVGEEALTKFISAWMNVKQGDPTILDNPKALFDGNYSELRQLLAARPNNEVRVLLEVTKSDKGDFYQNIYNKYFDRATAKTTTYWVKQLADQYGATKGDYQNSFDFQEYVAKAPSDKPDSETISKDASSAF